jgi:uncharacterized protein YukE
MTVTQLSTEEIITRIEDTKPDVLRAAAQAFDACEQDLLQVRGRMNGVIADTHQMWDSTAGRSFGNASGTVLKGLGNVGYTMGYVGRNLRAHADAADKARAALQPYRSNAPGPHPYVQSDAIKQSKVDAIAHEFHESEVRVRKALYSWGEQAPFGIPIPELPPKSEQAWWKDALFGEPPDTAWVTADGEPIAMQNQGAAPYGYDEDGNLVPAHQATYPGIYDPRGILGVTPGGIFKFLNRIPKTTKNPMPVTNGDEFLEMVHNSQGWRPGHRDRHLREFYNLKPNDPIPDWMRTRYDEVIRKAGEQAPRVFNWKLKGKDGPQPTYAILYKDPDTNKWIALQFYQDVKGQKFPLHFANAVEPTAHQWDEMMRAGALP